MGTTIVFGPGTTPQSGGSIPAEVVQYYSMRLLNAVEPDLKYTQFMADVDEIPKGTGTTMVMRRWELLPPNTTPLVEGVTPASDTPTVTPVSVGVAQYGRWVPVTDIMTWTAKDKVMSQITDKQGEQAARTLDQLARAVMTGGTGVQYANGRVSRVTIQSGDKITATEIKKAKRTLALAFVKRFSDGCYVSIISEWTVVDIEAMTEWVNVHTYSSGQADAIYKGEIGMLFGIRFVVHNEAVKFAGAGASGIDVFGSIVFGPEAFVRSTISGESLQQIIKPLGAGDDPMNQRCTTAWKAMWGGVVANQTYLVRIEHAAST